MNDAMPFNHFVRTDAKAVDLPWTLAQLQGTYFGKERTMDQLVEQIRNSLAFSLHRRDYLPIPGYPSHKDRQCGFARVITDSVSFGWIADFVIATADRGNGLGFFLMQTIVEHHALCGVTLNLGTRDATNFYAKFGFVAAETMMRRPPG